MTELKEDAGSVVTATLKRSTLEEDVDSTKLDSTSAVISREVGSMLVAISTSSEELGSVGVVRIADVLIAVISETVGVMVMLVKVDEGAGNEL